MAYQNVFLNKVVLVTGHTGFKGSWMATWLSHLGAKVVGLSVDIPTEPSNFNVSNVSDCIIDRRMDIRDADAVKQLVLQFQPDFVFHMAAQSLVRPSYENPLDTLTINSIGSANILDALRYVEKQVIAIMITSDKAYDNVEWVWGYRETDRLGGKNPYSASKGMAEIAIRAYIESFFNKLDSNVRVGIARAGNVIGGGDWAKDRIVSDCMNAWSNGLVVDIRSPQATRPWQHVLEPVSGYLSLASELFNKPNKHGEAYNFGPPANQDYTVGELIDGMSFYWENVRWNDVSQDCEHLHEDGLLKLNCDKALFDLDWLPTLQFEETIRMTVEWYKTYYKNSDNSMQEFTCSQIDEYMLLAKNRGMVWAEG